MNQPIQELHLVRTRHGQHLEENTEQRAADVQRTCLLLQGVLGGVGSGKSALVHRHLTGSYLQLENTEGWFTCCLFVHIEVFVNEKSVHCKRPQDSCESTDFRQTENLLHFF